MRTPSVRVALPRSCLVHGPALMGPESPPPSRGPSQTSPRTLTGSRSAVGSCWSWCAGEARTEKVKVRPGASREGDPRLQIGPRPAARNWLLIGQPWKPRSRPACTEFPRPRAGAPLASSGSPALTRVHRGPAARSQRPIGQARGPAPQRSFVNAPGSLGLVRSSPPCSQPSLCCALADYHQLESRNQVTCTYSPSPTYLLSPHGDKEPSPTTVNGFYHHDPTVLCFTKEEAKTQSKK